MNSRDTWVMKTRMSVARELFELGFATAGELEGNLDIDVWGSLPRTRREISAAFGWMVKEGYAVKVPKSERTMWDSRGVMYEMTTVGYEWYKNMINNKNEKGSK